MINKVLKLLRIANDWSRKEVADKTNLSISYIGEIENEARTPSLDTISRYAKAFDIPVSTIFEFAEKAEVEGYNYQKMLICILKKLIKD